MAAAEKSCSSSIDGGLMVYLAVLCAALFAVGCQGYAGGSPASRTTSTTLFSGDDSLHVMELHANNLTSTVTGSNHAWVVDMYASWCGHCQRFAPKWRTLANDIRHWSSVVKVAAVACSHPDNTEICRTYGVRSYPAIRFFPPYHRSEGARAHGEQYTGMESVTALRRAIIDFLQDTPHFPDTWPLLNPLDDLSTAVATETVKSAIIMEDTVRAEEDLQYLGREVILDLSAYHNQLHVRRMERTAAENYGVVNFPSLYQVTTDQSIFPVETVYELDRAGYRNILLTSFLGLEVEGGSTQRPSWTTTTVLPVRSNGVHQQDLESSVYYSFFHQVATHDLISGEPLQILKTHVDYLSKLLPVSHHTNMWLTDVSVWLKNHTGNLTGNQWKKEISRLQTVEAHIPERVVWVGCQGSKPHLRGYPCSLWQLFHTLTVAAYEEAGYSPRDILLNMKGYIRNFFSCWECADNFMEESANLEHEVTNREQGVIWLWRTHNSVNARLHSDPTEDPRHPKLQFPAFDQCDECRSSAEGENELFVSQVEWNEEQVFDYLNTFYTDIIKDSLPYNFVPHTEAPQNRNASNTSKAAIGPSYPNVVLIGMGYMLYTFAAYFCAPRS